MSGQTNLTSGELANKMEQIMAKKKVVRATPSKARKLISFWIKNSVKFITELEHPDMSQYKQMVRVYFISALCVGVFCYTIKVIHVPINNMLVN